MAIGVKKCCCFELPTAGIIIGWIGAVISILGVIGVLITLFFIETVKQIDEEERKSNYNDSATEDPTDRETALIIFHLATIYLVYLLLVCLAHSVISVLLIIGTKRKSEKLIMPWLIVAAIILVFEALFVFYLSLVEGILVHFGDYIGLVIGVYFWIVIYSLYKQIKDDKIRPQTYPNIQPTPVGMYHA